MSISKAQAKAIADGFLNTLGEQPMKEGEMPVAERLLKDFGADFIKTAQANLRQMGLLLQVLLMISECTLVNLVQPIVFL